MSWSYSSNFMGPAPRWYLDNLISENVFAGGRIDCECDDENDVYYNRYGVELILPIMDLDSFNNFSIFLENYTSDELKSFEELRAEFEKNGNKIRLFREQT